VAGYPRRLSTASGCTALPCTSRSFRTGNCPRRCGRPRRWLWCDHRSAHSLYNRCRLGNDPPWAREALQYLKIVIVGDACRDDSVGHDSAFGQKTEAGSQLPCHIVYEAKVVTPTEGIVGVDFKRSCRLRLHGDADGGVGADALSCVIVEPLNAVFVGPVKERRRVRPW
jgi:hypothetical protein